MRQRLISAAVLVPVVVIVFLLGDAWIALGIAVLAALAAYETTLLVRRAGLGADPWLAVVSAFIAAVAIRWLLQDSFFEPRPVFLTALAAAFAAVVVCVSAVLGLVEREPAAGFRRWIGNVLAALYPSLLALVVGLYMLAPAIGERALLSGRLDGPRTWLLVLVLTVWSLDTFAYVAGRFHGRGRFMNHISPNKTWSGVVGGTAAALLVCTLLVWAAGQHPLAGVVLGVVIAVSAQAGDLAESMLKRAAGAKDSGTWIPGHGGVLDRVDSFLFAGPAAFLAIVVGRAMFGP